MNDLPSDPKKIRARIRRYERSLEQEREKLGQYRDTTGKRYYLGPLYLLMGDLEGAQRSFAWFEREFPGDEGDPGQSLCWALTLLRARRRTQAVEKLCQAMLLNRYSLPCLLARDARAVGVSPENDELEMNQLEAIPEQFFEMWTIDERAWAAALYDGKLQPVRTRYLQIERELEHETQGERRSRLVNEASELKATVQLRSA
jgi:hypothetical protein